MLVAETSMLEGPIAEVMKLGIVFGLLMIFIRLLMQSAFITRKHHEDVIAGWKQLYDEKCRQEGFWMHYAENRDTDVAELTVATRKALAATEKVLAAAEESTRRRLTDGS